jgi:hypothetical protein
MQRARGALRVQAGLTADQTREAARAAKSICRAGDENRTRTISLGICAIRPVRWPDLRGGVSASDRERPLVTGTNGPLMAQPILADSISGCGKYMVKSGRGAKAMLFTDLITST